MEEGGEASSHLISFTDSEKLSTTKEKAGKQRKTSMKKALEGSGLLYTPLKWLLKRFQVLSSTFPPSSKFLSSFLFPSSFLLPLSFLLLYCLSSLLPSPLPPSLFLSSSLLLALSSYSSPFPLTSG
jgi:hypothetical protein